MKSHCSPEAKAICDRQMHYDRLHHLMRLAWLNSLPKLNALQYILISQSEAAIDNPMYAYKSVDVGDDEYIAELDRYALSIPTPDQEKVNKNDSM